MERDDYFVLGSTALFLFSVVSLVFALNSIGEYKILFTGKAVDSGFVNLSISSLVLLNFTDDTINFGSGSVNLGQVSATIDTLGSVINGNWSATTTRFLITNLGNENLTINVSSGKTASSFIGGSSPGYRYNVSDGGKDICSPPSGFSLDTFYEVNASPDSQRVCDVFESLQNITIDLSLIIPNNSNIGVLSDTISISYGEAA
ncbi:MAG: hypothetical protein IH845_03225 [Nanoarchaeota archaeon]|nr:hypothetical protein [Nanoarchaeota archaeon]